MKIIRGHCPADPIKASNSEYDFQNQHSSFNFPTIKGKSGELSKTIGKYFNRKRYETNSINEFKRSASIHLTQPIIDTSKKILLNYHLVALM